MPNAAAPSPPTKETLQEQLALIDRSQKFVLLIIIAISLSYYVTTIQKDQIKCLLCEEDAALCEDFPDTFPISLLSSTLVLISVIYFFIISDRALCDPKDTCVQKRSDSYNNTASLFVLLAAIIRIINLMMVWKSQRQVSESSDTI
ncbi:MAG: hypothetical protein HFI90_07140 [Clostridia bacterium]|nr:hypothetical protein [Clostridia bacterium]